MNAEPVQHAGFEVLGLPGHYRVLERLAPTRTGLVLRARDVRRNADVAVKVHLAGLCNAPVRLAIDRERDALLRLRGAPVPRLLDAGVSAAGHPYLVSSLARGVASEAAPLSPNEAIRVLGGVLGALRAAHGTGFVHADVNPSNVLAAGEGWLLGDWGSCHRPRADTCGASRYLGTPGSMAPEQMRGERLTPAADLFALALTVVALCDGVPLITGESVEALAPLFGDLRPVASPRLAPLPARVRSALLDCLHPDPARRPADAGVLSEGLLDDVPSQEARET